MVGIESKLVAAATPKWSTVKIALYHKLADRSWYSYSVRLLLRECGIVSRTQLVRLCTSVAFLVDDKINFFTYNKIEYVGFESRRVDYENDKKLGINRVEKLINAGVYDK